MAEYIEREAAFNAIVNNYDTDAQLRELDSIPAADVVPVRHGKWEELGKYSDGYNWRCSVCKRESVMAANYCPFCGALMDKDGDGE